MKRNNIILSIPDYDNALSNNNRRKIVKAISQMQGVTSFSNIERSTGVKANVLTHNLRKLQKFRVIDMVTKGTYKLRYRTPLCYICQQQSKHTDVVYVGLLGKKDSRQIPETAVALQLLASTQLYPKLVYVSTSIDGLESWRNLKLPYYWITLYEDEIFDIDTIKQKIRPQLESLLREFLVILDCTSATKPATVAYYELAREYLIPLVYVYEQSKKLKWLISTDSLAKTLFLQ